MREIKLRAYCEEEKRMLYADLNELILGKNYDFKILYQEGKLSKPMRFIGLQDKNGQEIYEGDIVKHIDCGIGEVKFDDRFASFVGPNGCTIYGHDCEVIGNKFEHPEGFYIRQHFYVAVDGVLGGL